ncbi:glycoside hydrolase family 43 protein [Amnibacterium kyonggiense]|uniref:Glycosyl hydrolase family 43 n=1 Tax=Amnibacterium kyonggiense TaxID=595671 RepID=A0A4R7FRD0_9MICO|nr:glycoside hydrolase family 43 protein [Amnibacterium kyonggiense]TDS80343.1 hypothetical protein CLV52_0900 [Amnibacterium kyonggiense]
MTTTPDVVGYLLAYFHSELEEDGEQIRFAVSIGNRPDAWTMLNGDRPVLRSSVGMGGARDPFLVRDERAGRFFVLATDLRTWPDHETAWTRSLRHGSRGILVWESTDLTEWSDARLVEVAPASVGNVWAPKAFWSESRQRWLMFWASALFEDDEDRTPGGYQRILVAETEDFRSFSEPQVHLDFGHDVIDLAFVQDGDAWYRFSANAHSPGGSPDLGNHIFEERGTALEDPVFEPFRIDIGKPELRRGEGPAVARAIAGDGAFLLIDEFLLRGYQLFETQDLAGGEWQHIPDAHLPPGARHGSLLAITAAERDRLLHAYP